MLGKEEYKSYTFQSNTNFVVYCTAKNRLHLSLNIEFNQIDDPLGLCLDVTDKGRWEMGYW